MLEAGGQRVGRIIRDLHYQDLPSGSVPLVSLAAGTDEQDKVSEE